MPTDLSRRDLLRLGLIASAAAGLAACTTATNGGPSATATTPGGPEDPDRALRTQVGLDEARLVALYAAAAAVLSGSQATRVAALGERHAAYLRAIDPDALTTPSPTGSVTGSSGSGGAPSPGTSQPLPQPLPPVTAGTARTVLLAAETTAADSRARQSAAAVDPTLARVIVLAGTGAASAATVLSSGRAR
jgi:hypothetical protein